MGVKVVTVTEAARHFSDYLNRVAYRRESFVLCKGRRAMAEWRPVPAGTRLGELQGLLKSVARLSPEEAKAFSDDVRRARKTLPPGGLKDPWAS